MIHAIAGLATLTVAQTVALAHGFGTLARPLGGYNQAFTYSLKMTRLMFLALVLMTMVAEIQGQGPPATSRAGSDMDTTPKPGDACGGHFTGINGVIASPGHPGFYPNDQNCLWKIDVPPPGRIRLQFGTLRMETSPTCEYDFLKISTPGTPPSKYCGVVAPNDVITPGNTVTIHFISDHSIDDKGFSISYSVVTDGRDLQDILDRIGGLEDHITQLKDTVIELTTNNANLASQLAATKEELKSADFALSSNLQASWKMLANAESTLSSQLAATKAELKSADSALSSQLAAVNNTVTETLEELTISQEPLPINDSSLILSACSRNFHARLGRGNVVVPRGHTVVYTHVLLNQWGGYDDVTGVFTCSVPGTYMFHVHALTPADTSHHANLDLYHNDARVASLSAGWDQDNLDSSSLSAVLYLQSGDKVKVTSSNTSTLYGYYYDTFTGALLHAAAC